ncbi:NAD(P)-binding protein [Karstenula rhodostoma CBS 690.94]|uniref:NAD(P)-binding protein n=1 Tax=Karstenula rhodostoma CBS 690.94 TaxID=1392251 RepID=A0A9P4P7T3_9PLEO|nr:NAD(P)-binding protein [Karstenula rhodostoma CBS 690.94]
MKLIVAGATGFVGGEIIRLALRNKSITSVVALARKEVPVPKHAGTEADTSKLKTVVLEDWEKTYPEHVIQQLSGADACVWALAVTPTKSKDANFEDVTKICYDYTINGLKNMTSVANKPFRFVYTSGVTVERDQTKALPFLHDYRLMRGRVENAILEFAKQTPAVEVAITKPGGIEGPGHPKNDAMTSVWTQFGPTPWVHLSELAAAMIEQAVSGVSKETLWGNDLVEIGSRVLKKDDYVPME